MTHSHGGSATGGQTLAWLVLICHPRAITQNSEASSSQIPAQYIGWVAIAIPAVIARREDKSLLGSRSNSIELGSNYVRNRACG